MPERPDFVLSGINHGQNMGEDVLYSGTVAAAMEGVTLGVPAIALSFAGGELKADPALLTDQISAVSASAQASHHAENAGRYTAQRQHACAEGERDSRRATYASWPTRVFRFADENAGSAKA